MSLNKLPPSEIFTEEASEEEAAPHFAAGAEPAEEVWTRADPSVLPAARTLTQEEKWPGEWHAIAWMYAHGTSQRQIARELDYTESRISIILNKPEVHDKIEQIRREFLGTESLTKKFSGIAPKAAEYLAKVIEGKEAAKVGERLQASQWMLEKVTGKPKQEVSLDGGTTILQLLQALDSAKEARAAERTREVSAATAPDIELQKEQPKDALADWVAKNVPEPRSDKGT